MKWPADLIAEFDAAFEGAVTIAPHTKEEAIQKFLDMAAGMAAYRAKKWGDGAYIRDLGVTGVMLEAYFSPFTPIGTLTANPELWYMKQFTLDRRWGKALDALREFIRRNADKILETPSIVYDDRI